MKKNLYSLMLNDEVVREIDLLAHRMGTNRSNLIDQILADYVNYTTPERRINNILSALSEIIEPSQDLVPFFTPNTYSMSVKSSLEYKYRPTIKYGVELYKGWDRTIGEISVIFRTHSEVLLDTMNRFFLLWESIENKYLSRVIGTIAGYELYDGKFIRSIIKPQKDCSAKELATLLSEYIRIFDILLKGYLTGQYSEKEIEELYYTNIIEAEVLI